jgi:[protein]-arginine 3-hydroxylase / protease
MNRTSVSEAITHVPTMDDGSIEEFLALSHQYTRPVVIARATSTWPAATQWNIESLRARFGEQPVQVVTSLDGVFRGDPKAGFTRVTTEMPLSRFFDLISSSASSGERYYLQQLSIAGPFTPLLQDIVVPRYIGEAPARAHLWFSPEGNVSPLHFDLAHNLLTQVMGRKRLLLFSPEQTPLLYPHARQSKIPHMSQVDIQHPDLVLFPKFSRARSVEVVLEEGQMLFLPILWWHQVSSLDTTISVNFWWTPDYMTG